MPPAPRGGIISGPPTLQGPWGPDTQVGLKPGPCQSDQEGPLRQMDGDGWGSGERVRPSAPLTPAESKPGTEPLPPAHPPHSSNSLCSIKANDGGAHVTWRPTRGQVRPGQGGSLRCSDWGWGPPRPPSLSVLLLPVSLCLLVQPRQGSSSSRGYDMPKHRTLGHLRAPAAPLFPTVHVQMAATPVPQIPP